MPIMIFGLLAALFSSSMILVSALLAIILIFNAIFVIPII